MSQLRQGQMPPEVVQEGEVYYYTCPISQTQQLAVEVRILGESYEVIRWQAQSTMEWVSDDTLDVWDGNLSTK